MKVFVKVKVILKHYKDIILLKVKSYMSRLYDQAQRLTERDNLLMRDNNRQEALNFQTFYESTYYSTFKDGILEELANMDRNVETKDVQALLLKEGRRSSLRSILDKLDKMEKFCSKALKQ